MVNDQWLVVNCYIVPPSAYCCIALLLVPSASLRTAGSAMHRKTMDRGLNAIN